MMTTMNWCLLDFWGWERTHLGPRGYVPVTQWTTMTVQATSDCSSQILELGPRVRVLVDEIIGGAWWWETMVAAVAAEGVAGCAAGRCRRYVRRRRRLLMLSNSRRQRRRRQTVDLTQHSSFYQYYATISGKIKLSLSIYQTFYCWTSRLSCRWWMERFTFRHYLITVAAFI